MSYCPKVLFHASFVTVCFVVLSAASWGQASHSDQVQVMPPQVRTVDAPSPDATADDLEKRADELHAQKLYLDAIDYYRAALKKTPNDARLLNKVCRTQLMLQRWKDARSNCELSIKADHKFADPHNNEGVALYEMGRTGAAIKQYQKAIGLDDSSASFFSNLGAAEFAKKQFDKALDAYQKALQLDPDVFERSSRTGVQAQVAKPQDRAFYDYSVAKLYAKMGLSDRSLEYLRKAREEGYKDLKKVYTDTEFAELRKDKRFAELMAAKVPSLPD